MKTLLSTIILFITLSLISFAQNDMEEMKNHFDNKDFEEAFKHVNKIDLEKVDKIDELLLIGDVNFEMDKFDAALKAYQKAWKKDKSDNMLTFRVTKALVALNQREEAIDLLKNAVKKDNKNPKVYLELAKAYLAFDSLNRAELVITQARDLDSKNPEAYLLLGDLYYAQRVYELARSNYEDALSLNPDFIDARVKLATSYYKLANQETDENLSSELFTKSVNEWNQVGQKDPKNAKAFFEQGKIWWLANRFENAAKALSKFVELRPSGSLGRWWLAQSFEKIGMYDSALYHLNIVTNEIDTIKVKANLSKARCYFDLKDYPKAIESYSSVKKDTLIDVIDFQKLGQAYILSKDTLNAINTWTESINLKPAENCRMMDQVAFIMQRYKKPGDTLPDYIGSAKMLEKRVSFGECNNDKNHIAYYYMGNAYNLAGQPANAIEPLKKSILADSTFMFSRVALGDAYAALKDIANAEIELTKVIDLGSSDTTKNKFALTNAFQKLSGLMMENKKFNDVIKVANRWSALFPNEWGAYLYLAFAHHQLKNLPEACKNYKKVLSINPKMESARKNLKSIQDAGACGE